MMQLDLSNPMFNDVKTIKSREELDKAFDSILDRQFINAHLLMLTKTILELWDVRKNEIYINTGKLTEKS